MGTFRQGLILVLFVAAAVLVVDQVALGLALITQTQIERSMEAIPERSLLPVRLLLSGLVGTREEFRY